jgi:HD-like signal output (HDOD) protein
MPQSLPELIASTKELRALPATTVRLMELLDDATVGADAVLDVIATDPSLTANLLKLSNSAYYGLRRQVGSAREALVRLGNRTVVNLAFATSMGDILRGPLGSYRLGRRELWHHSLGTALGAAYLGAVAGDGTSRDRATGDRAFTAGLVHDIGKLLLNEPLKEHLLQLPPGVTDAALLAAETEILGFNHAQAGAALGEAWNFPPSLVAVIGGGTVADGQPLAADPSDPVEAQTRAVAGANAVAAFCGFGGGAAAPDVTQLQEIMQNLGYSAETMEDLVVRLPADLEAMLGVIGESR